MSKLKDETNNRYGRLLVIKRSDNCYEGEAMWLCRCECGKEVVVSGKSLRNGYTKSCGCIRRDMMIGNTYSRFTGMHHTPESKQKISSGNKNKTISVETRKKLSIARTGVPQSPESCLKKSIASMGKNNPMYGKPAPHGIGNWYNTSNGFKIWMRSSYEIRVATILTKLNIQWEYEKNRFELDNMTYCPDFYLPEYDIWWEVKGYMRENAHEKIEKFYGTYKNEILVIIRLNDIESLEHDISNNNIINIMEIGNNII